MAPKRRSPARYTPKKRDAVTVGRRAAIGILIVALVVLGILLVVNAKKKPSQAAPPNPTRSLIPQEN